MSQSDSPVVALPNCLTRWLSAGSRTGDFWLTKAEIEELADAAREIPAREVADLFCKECSSTLSRMTSTLRKLKTKPARKIKGSESGEEGTQLSSEYDA